jgi:beta-lactamase regulating signal transducer with metallopeptidase domain
VIVDIWAPLVLPLLVAPLLALPALRALPDRMHPRTACWALTAAAVGLAGGSAVALALLTGVAVLRLPPVAAYAHLHVPIADETSTAVVLTVGAVAAALLTASATAAGRSLRRQWTDLAAARRLAAGHRACGDLVVVPDDTADAYALPGIPVPGARSGRVVVTRGMLRALAPAEREVLLAHERAHLACRHHLFIAATEVAAAVHPLLRPLRDGLCYAVERWADEEAAARVADRPLTARAIGRAALAGAGATAAPRRVLAAAAGPVPRRVAALLGGEAARRAGVAPRGRVLLVTALLAGALALSVGTALDAAHDFHQQVEHAQREARGTAADLPPWRHDGS